MSEFIFYLSLSFILYTTFGYPLLLYILSLFINKRVNRGDILPSVTIIIPVHNEEKLIKTKIINCLNFDYPKEKFDIIIVSDCSTDNTEKIANSFNSKQLKLLSLPKREGKVTAQNYALQYTNSEIIIFTDVAITNDPNCIKLIIQNFNDEKIGAVSCRDLIDNADKLEWESHYIRYDMLVRKYISRIGTLIGVTGGFYAVRKILTEGGWDPNFPPDFYVAIKCIYNGFRVIEDSRVIAHYKTAADRSEELPRKIRTLNRGMWALFLNIGLLNIFKYKLISVELISHKLYRWLTPFFLISLFFSHILIWNRSTFTLLTISMQLVLYSLIIVFLLVNKKNRKKSILIFPGYLYIVNLAILKAWYEFIKGKKYVKWTPTKREDINYSSYELQKSKNKLPPERLNQLSKCYPLILLFLLTALIFCGLFLITQIIPHGIFFLSLIFWFSTICICYTFIGYPLILSILATMPAKSIDKKEIYPSVSLVIPAYNEEEIIEDKIKNSLSLDYPKDKLHIIIASDGSDDQTNEIINKHIDKGIKFYNYSPRRGKINVLNRVMQQIDTEIVLFSDANIMYQADAVKKIVRNFNDNTVGAVSGNAILINNPTAINKPEGFYYKYERYIQKCESMIGSIIGADGAIYAIRRHLYGYPSSNIILDDFVISMEIIRRNYRVIYDPEVQGYESSISSLAEEYKRKRRIGAGILQTLVQREGTPGFGNKLILFQYFSHKILRWLMPFWIMFLFFSTFMLKGIIGYAWVMAFILLLIPSAFIGYKIKNSIFTMPLYLFLNFFSLCDGYGRGILNLQPVTWEKMRSHKD